MNRTQQFTEKRRRIAAKGGDKALHAARKPSALRSWQVAAVCFILAASTAALYGPVASHPFVDLDDPSYVSENQHVQAGLSWQTLSWAVASTDAANWHPLTWLSHALDCQLYGLDAGGHHVTNVVIHVINVILIFLLLLRATGAAGPSSMVAAIFALHPLNVESVAWIAERKNLLSMLFFLLALGAYGWYVQKPSWKRYSVVALFFALGLASKPMVITLPFVLLLLDYWPLRRIQDWTPAAKELPGIQYPWYRLALEKVPLLLLSVGSALITVIAQSRGKSITSLGPIPLTWRLENTLYSYSMYLAKVFWPADLAIEYPHPLHTLGVAQIAFSFVLLVSASILVWQQRIKRPYALTGWFWFLGTLVPMIGIVQVGAQGMADRYMYLPAIGIFLVAAWAAADLIRAAALDFRWAALVSLALLAILSVITFRQIGYWRSSLDIWRHALDVTKDNFIADDAMGELLLREGNPEALEYFEAAAKIAPWDPESHAMVAGNLQDHGDLQQAIQEYSIALRAHPDAKLRAHIYADLGIIYRQLGDYTKAREASHLALTVDAQEVQDMIQQLSATLEQRPAAPGYWLLGLLLEGADQVTEAKSAYEQALRLNRDFSPASRALAEIGTNPGQNPHPPPQP